MKRSLFLELLDEEASIPRGAIGKFESFKELEKMLQARSSLVEKMDAAKAEGQLTEDQYAQLLSLVRKHALPPA